nr:hypothetical protein Iba_scaffold21144CG0110 [Ipomoea batatas]
MVHHSVIRIPVAKCVSPAVALTSKVPSSIIAAGSESYVGGARDREKAAALMCGEMSQRAMFVVWQRAAALSLLLAPNSYLVHWGIRNPENISGIILLGWLTICSDVRGLGPPFVRTTKHFATEEAIEIIVKLS